MLAFGRAMMAQPAVLLLDEPSLGLAPILVEEVASAIERFHRDGATILLVEQNAELALGLASRGFVIETGRIVLTDTGPNLLENPKVWASYLGQEDWEFDAADAAAGARRFRMNDWNKERLNMTELKRRLLAAGLLASAVMIRSAGIASADTIKIGVFGPFSGDAAATGASERQAVDLAVKEKNAAGGIRGKQIEPIYADDAGKPEEAVNVAKRLTERDNVVIMIGSISSPASLAASQVAAQSQTRADRGVGNRAEDHHPGQQMGVPFAGARHQAGWRPRDLHPREISQDQKGRVPLRQRRFRPRWL